jgi:uncharacterized membrane protein
VACSIKQTPWFCVPLLVIGLGIEARRWGDTVWRVPGRYLAVVVGVFAACNLPFVIWGPRAWADGVLLPFTKPLVADGQGLVTLAIHGLTGGVVLPLLSLAGALAYVALLAAFVAWYPAMKVVFLFVLPVVLLVPGRSFSNYLIDFFPAALVAAVTVAGVSPPARVDGGPPARRWWARAAVGVPALASAAVCVLAFTSAPLDLSVVAVRTSQATQRLDAVTVTVHNLTGHAVTPHFLVVIDSTHPSGFWAPAGLAGPLVLGPGRRARSPCAPTNSPGRPRTAPTGWSRPTPPRPTLSAPRPCRSGRSGTSGERPQLISRQGR